MTDNTVDAPNRGGTPPGPLDGVTVLEMGTLIAGPHAARLLGDMGADIIKIEPPGKPDPIRTWGQAEVDGHRFYWTVHARNKKAITLDLRSDRGREIFLQLADRADIVVENFRPGTLERLGIGPDVLSERNPGLVIVRVSGYGQTGPDATRAGYASVAEAASGLRYLNGYPGQLPPRLALSIGDTLAGMFAAQGALAALYRRTVTGKGQVVDTSLIESCVAVQESAIADYDAGGVVRGPSGTRLEGIAPSNLYPTSDGTHVIIAANQDSVFARLCQAMGRPELATDERFADHTARGRNQDELDMMIGDWSAQYSAEKLTEVLSAAGVVVGPVNTVAEVVADPHLRARGMIAEHYDEGAQRTVLGPGVVPQFSETPGGIRNAGPPTPGYDNEAVYGEMLGLSSADLTELHEGGVI
ncbi:MULTISPECIES: CaiB/BaiF CoA transferase family protein [Gordonia]|uniref:CaiB/BaiF CoA transferase family protein n=1 Tax=Gordonia TaxID=2053 RepID=UPI0024492211|nr:MULTISPECIES: CaiB/BaiF CoA-transferase family protein [Gordonia]MDH3009272.1 CaiB/BaiF CoA-transferase family protein [Gordonia alkanivorans]MDH3010612.1 CaiB/BaiF CoA-transferase family protein [Gordonia alkanivorans]MDH3043564.1 CaiB/BaiF CoA-transferase family protein [Gordonia alkanivorans]MDH3048070.1 CaiB/BaiF CoA-transferase family protein [Gordonia alkanivorans]WJG12430.1 CaiB/BaiF CoA-transferase family protein [Gordonia sp. Swx-4]